MSSKRLDEASIKEAIMCHMDPLFKKKLEVHLGVIFINGLPRIHADVVSLAKMDDASGLDHDSEEGTKERNQYRNEI